MPIYVSSHWKIQDRRQIKNTRHTQTKHNSENTKHSKTKLAWFSRFLRHSARKQGGLILQCSRAHTGQSIGLCSVIRPRQHSIGYMGDCFYRSKDPTNSIKALNEMLQRKNQTTKTTKYTYVLCCFRCLIFPL